MINRVLTLLLITSLVLLIALAPPSAEARKHPGSHHVERTSSHDAARAAAKNRHTRNITRTFSNTGPIAIPGSGTSGPANAYPATIQVSGFKKGKIKDVNLFLYNFTHTEPVDVDVLLVATQLPDRTATVLSDVGGGDAFAVNLVLDDQALTPLPQIGPLVSGTFQPTNADPFVNEPIDPFPAPAPVTNGNALLGVFEGGDPNGTWQLYIVDDQPLDTGSLAGGWALEITAQVKKKH